MPETNINAAVASDLTNVVTEFSVAAQTTDAPTAGRGLFRWTNEKAGKYLGYYKEIPELGSAIDAIARWTVGKGFTAEPDVEMILDTIKGFGRDTFNTILENLIRSYHIYGDAFAEIIRDKEGNLINIKVLDPGSITIVTNSKGILQHYEQKTKNPKQFNEFKKEKILHLARNRIADEVHGISIIERLEWIIKARNEAMKDMKVVFHRYVKPFNIIHLDTDDETEIAAFKTKMDKINEDTENIYIPKGIVEVDRQSVPQFSTLNPLPWIEALNDYFFEACGVPKIVVGASKNFTDASSKISYVSWQQTVEEEQLFLEEQFLLQVRVEFQLEFPATIQNELISDNQKDGAVNIDQSETQETPLQ